MEERRKYRSAEATPRRSASRGYAFSRSRPPSHPLLVVVELFRSSPLPLALNLPSRNVTSAPPEISSPVVEIISYLVVVVRKAKGQTSRRYHFEDISIITSNFLSQSVHFFFFAIFGNLQQTSRRFNWNEPRPFDCILHEKKLFRLTEV